MTHSDEPKIVFRNDHQLAQDEEKGIVASNFAEPPRKLLLKRRPKSFTTKIENAVSKQHEIAKITNCEADDQYSIFGQHIASQQTGR